MHLRMRDEAGEVVAATECYECKPAPVPKSYPVCTIRNTPDKPIHCIVWAKDLLFARLFGRCGSAAHPWAPALGPWSIPTTWLPGTLPACISGVCMCGMRV